MDWEVTRKTQYVAINSYKKAHTLGMQQCQPVYWLCSFIARYATTWVWLSF